jgi:hypothetical protein
MAEIRGGQQSRESPKSLLNSFPCCSQTEKYLFLRAQYVQVNRCYLLFISAKSGCLSCNLISDGWTSHFQSMAF